MLLSFRPVDVGTAATYAIAGLLAKDDAYDFYGVATLR